MGVVGCILGFLVVIYLCYKDWSVYIASIVGAAVVIAFNVLPFMDTLLGSYVNGMFVPIKSFFFLLLFGSIQSKIYSESGAAVEVVVIIVLMNIYINKARAKGEHFELHPLDPHYDKSTPRPNFWIALIPLVALFVAFNILKININICVIGSTVLSILLFWKQLKAKNLRELISTGAADSIHMSLTVAAICGFAGVVTNTEAFTTMLNAITGINMSPMLICAVVVAVMCMLTGGSSTGQLISLPLIAPKLLDLGLNVNAIHRIACFAATTLDSMPYSGAILMLLPMCRMKLREIYPPMFITTVIATTCGTAAVIVMCALFPGLC